jgi:cytochrome P450
MAADTGFVPTETRTRLGRTAFPDALDEPQSSAPVESGTGLRTPYPAFAALRRQHPVHRGSPWQLTGLAPEGRDERESGPAVYTVVSYEHATRVLRDSETFSSSGYAAIAGVIFGRSILEMDGAEHRHYRSLVQQAFSKAALARWEQELIGPAVDRFIDAFAARGHADLVRELTFPFPVQVVARLLGLPESDLRLFHRWAADVINIFADWDRAMAASKALGRYLGEVVDDRRLRPRDDLISRLLRADVDGHRLSDDEIVAFLRLLLPAGAETTYRSLGNLLFALLTHPDQLDALYRDRSLVPRAIEEAIRWEPPETWIMRWATRDTEIAGVRIAAGSVVGVCLGSANRDEGQFPNGEEFDIFRPPAAHLGFAHGPHVCPGLHLARMEISAALNALLDRLPELQLDCTSDPHIAGLLFRSPTSLPVTWPSAGAELVGTSSFIRAGEGRQDMSEVRP